MSDKIKILYTIPNFDTAGSCIPLFKIASELDKNYFDIQIACLHNRGELFKNVKKSGIKIHIIDLYKNTRPVSKMLKECYQLSKIFKNINPRYYIRLLNDKLYTKDVFFDFIIKNKNRVIKKYFK